MHYIYKRLHVIQLSLQLITQVLGEVGKKGEKKKRRYKEREKRVNQVDEARLNKCKKDKGREPIKQK